MPALVVEVVGDTQKLTKGLSDAERQLKGFSRRTSTIHGTGADQLLADVRALKESGRQTIDTFNEVDTAAVAAGSSLAGMGLKAGLAGLAVYTLNQNLSQAGGGLGKFGNAMSSLMTGDFVGFAKKASDNTEELKGFEKELFESHNATKAMNIANKLAAAGLDEWAEAARRAELAIMRVTDAAVDLTKVHDPTSPGAIAADPTRGGVPRTPFKPKPLTAEQRRAFFDARIGREIDRSQDIKTVQGQVAALRNVADEIQNRIDATKDITRRLNLEDQLVAVNRRAQSLLDQAAGDAAAAAAKAARERAQALREAAAAARAAEAAQLDWLDFALEKAEDTKTHKDDLKALRDRETFLKQMIRREGETLDRVRELWRTRKQIRDLNKSQADEGDPLAGLMQVSSARLTSILAAGTGLGAAGRRVLSANIAGAELRPLYVSVQLDGREVGRAVTKQQTRTSARTAKQTSGFRG